MFHTQIEFPYGEGRRSTTRQGKHKDTAQAALTSTAIERAKLDAVFAEMARPDREAGEHAVAIVAECLAILPAAVRAELAQLAHLVDQRSAELSSAQRLYAEHTDDNDAARDSRSFKQRNAELLGAVDAAIAEVRAARQHLKDAMAPHRALVVSAYHTYTAASVSRSTTKRAEARQMIEAAFTEESTALRVYQGLNQLDWL